MTFLKILAYSLIAFAQAVVVCWFNWLTYPLSTFYNFLFSFLLYLLLGILFRKAISIQNKYLFFGLSIAPILTIYVWLWFAEEKELLYFVVDLFKLISIICGVIWSLHLETLLTQGFRKILFAVGGIALNIFMFWVIETSVLANLEYRQSQVFVKNDKSMIFEQTNVIDRNEKQIQLKNNQVCVFNFTFYACGPCRQKAPVYEKLAAKFNNNPNVIFYTIHEVENFGFFQDEYKKVRNAYHDKGGFLATKLDLNEGFPMEVIVDKKGEIRNIYSGFSNDVQDEYLKQRTKLIKQLLHEK